MPKESKRSREQNWSRLLPRRVLGFPPRSALVRSNAGA
jgi:hypothetical protein